MNCAKAFCTEHIMLCHTTQGCRGLELFHILLLCPDPDPDPDPCWHTAITELLQQMILRKKKFRSTSLLAQYNAMTELRRGRLAFATTKKSRTVNCRSTFTLKLVWFVFVFDYRLQSNNN